MTSADTYTRAVPRLDEFGAWLAARGMSAATVSCYLSGMKQYYKRVEAFSGDGCRAFVQSLERAGRAPQTIQIRITAMVNYAEFAGIGVKIPRIRVPRSLSVENIPTPAEYRRLLDYLRGTDWRWYMLVKILATTGARRSELMQFRWCDIVARTVICRGKGAKFRRFFFVSELADEVQRAIAGHKVKARQPVCCNAKGLPYTPRRFGQRLRELAEATGIAPCKLHPHAFRHFFALRYLEQSGGNLVGLAAILGHSDIKTTQIYLQKSEEEQKNEYNDTVTW